MLWGFPTAKLLLWHNSPCVFEFLIPFPGHQGISYVKISKVFSFSIQVSSYLIKTPKSYIQT